MKSYEQIKRKCEALTGLTPPNPNDCTLNEVEDYFGKFMELSIRKPHYIAKGHAEFSKVYECEKYTCDAHPQGCFFCKHLTDVFIDPFSGPYGWCCELHNDRSQVIDNGLFGKCNDFEVDE